MIVVSNTSPLTNLAAIGRFDLLHQLFGTIHIAEGVWDELNSGGKPWPGSREVANAAWVERHTVQQTEFLTALRKDLDRGEAETIALALEMDGDLVLIDEKSGRYAAERHGLKPLGVVGVLLNAKAAGHLDAIKPSLDGLRQEAGFYLSEAFYQRALALADETTAS